MPETMQAPWSLVQYRTPSRRALRTGVLVAGVVREAPPELAGLSVLDVIQAWATSAPVLQRLRPETLREIREAELAAPLTFPGKILCAGANYYDHCEEMGTARPSPDDEPFFFLKPPTTTVVGPGALVPYPSGGAVNLDWEAELAVVIGRTARNVSVDTALDHVAGYLPANDLSARGAFERRNAVMEPFRWDWMRHKALDGSCPIGPALTPAWFVPDPQALKISLELNGKTRQDSTTADMVIGVAALIAGASRIMTLCPGDVILTGTPAGVGLPGGEFLKPGDSMVVTIETLGQLVTMIGDSVD